MAKSNLPAHLAGNTLPAHLQLNSNAGNEEVTASDLQMPRIKLLQKISPELEEGHERFVPGAKAGEFLNTVTNESQQDLYCINLHFARGYTAFKKKQFGGGFGGEYESEALAIEGLQNQDEDPTQYDIVENHRHTLLLIDGEGNVQMPALMDFTSTKLRASKSWNSDIAIKCDRTCPRFGLVYKLSPMKQSNAKGSWFGVAFEFAGYASEDMYAKAQSQYESIFGTDKETNDE